MEEILYSAPLMRTQPTWDFLFENISRQKGISNDIKRQWKEAVDFLKKELDPGFLKNSGRNHPIILRLLNFAPWQVDDVIELANTLRKLKISDSNYPHLLKKIESHKKCKTEGIPFVEIAKMYLDSKFQVRFVVEQHGQKNPDIEIFCLHTSSDTFYIEVSKLDESNERKKLDDNYKLLSNIFNFSGPQLPFSCTQLKYISPEDTPNVVNIISNIRERAMKEEEIIFYNDDKIRLAVAHPSKFGELENWIVRNDHRKGLNGPPLNFDETSRISRYKIAHEAKQLPPNSTGLIYIPVNTLYFLVLDIEKTIENLKSQMKAYPHIMGVVIFSSIIDDTKPATLLFDGHFYGIKKQYDTITRHLLFVRNEDYQGSLGIGTVKKIYRSFE